MIEDRLRERDREHPGDLYCHSLGLGKLSRIEAEPQTKRPLYEQVSADVDGGEHRDQSGQVKPGRGPAPTPAAQDRRPMIQTARRGKSGSQLSHGGRERQGQQTGQRPAQADAGPAHAAQPKMKGRHAAGQNANDRQGNCIIGKGAHPPPQFLPVAERVQGSHIFCDAV